VRVACTERAENSTNEITREYSHHLSNTEENTNARHKGENDTREQNRTNLRSNTKENTVMTVRRESTHRRAVAFPKSSAQKYKNVTR
jgi:hypothetical protein